MKPNAKGPGNLDVPALRRLRDLDKPDFTIVMRAVFDAINAVEPASSRTNRHASCTAEVQVGAQAPAPEIQSPNTAISARASGLLALVGTRAEVADGAPAAGRRDRALVRA